MWPFPEVAATTSERRFRVILIAALAIVGLAMQWVWVNKHLTARTQLAWYP